MAHIQPDGPAELLECLDILFAAVEYKQDQREHMQRVTSFYDYYDDSRNMEDEGTQDEYDAQFEVLSSLYPERDFTDDEFETALWQTAMLGMTLLVDQEALIQTLDEISQEQEVSKIIQPSLTEIQAANQR